MPPRQSLSYRPRIVDAELARRLKSAGAVVVDGPKACGKTATARQAAASEVLLDVETETHRLGPGDLFVVPKGMRHRPRAEVEAKVLLIEPKGTPNTGDPETAAPRRVI